MLINNKNPNKKTSPRGKATLLLLVILVSVVTALPIFYPTNAGAVKAYADMSPGDQIKAYLYTGALTNCFKNAALSHEGIGYSNVKASDVASGKWFHTLSIPPATGNEVVAAGIYMIGTPGVRDKDAGIGFKGEMGEVDCDNTSFIMSSLAALGLEPLDVLCNSGFVRDGIDLSGKTEPEKLDKCKTATTDLSRSGDKGDSATKFASYVNSQVGIQSFTDAQWYAFYQGTLAKSCIPGITAAPDTTMDTTDNKKGYKDVKWVDITTDPDNPKIITGSYIGAMETGKEVFLYSDLSGKDAKSSCQGIADAMSSKAQAFADYAKTDSDGASKLLSAAAATNGSGTDPEDDKSCGAQVTALGWIICPIINGLTKLNDAMWGLVSGLLFVSPLDSSTKLYDAWGSIRSIANVVFVAFFLIIILSQLSGAGISNYGVKKLLPKIIVAAILVNLSFIIVQVAVDLANVIGYSLYNLLQTITPTIDPAKSNWVALVKLLEGVGVAGAAATGVLVTIITVGGIAAAFWMLLPIALMAALGLLVAVLTLIFRQAVIPVLAILAPLAFVAYLLPNTESWFKKWLKLFMSMLMMFPLAAVVFGGAQFASYTIIGDGKDFWNLLIGLIILTMPLFSLPFLARQGGPLLTKVGGAMKGVTDKARAPLSNFSKSYQDRAHDRYLAGDSSKLAKGLRSRFNNNRFVGENSRLGRTGLGRLGAKAVNGTPMQKTARWMQGGKLVRAEEAETAKKEFKSQVFNDQVKGVKGSPTRMKSIDRSKNDQSDAKEQASQHAASPIGEKSVDRLGKAELQTTVDSGDAEHRLATDLTPGGGRDLHQAVKISQGESAIDKKKIDRRYDTSAEGRILGRQLGERELLKKSDDAATANRVAGSRVGQIGHQAVSEGQGRTAIDTKDIAHRYSTSGTGIVQENALNAAEIVERTDKANAGYRTESDPGLLKVRLDAAGSEGSLAGARAENKQFATEASAKGGEAKIVAQLGAQGVGATEAQQIAGTLQRTQRATDIATSATNSATRIVKQEYQEALLTPAPPPPAGVAPGPSTAELAAGIDPLGVARVEAGSTAARAKDRADDVSYAGTSFASEGYGGSDYLAAATGTLRGGAPANSEQQEAAAHAVIQSGFIPNISALIDHVVDPAVRGTPEGIALQKSLGSMLSSSSSSPNYASGGVIDQLKKGTLTANTDDQVLATIASKKLSKESFKKMDVDEMIKMRDALRSGAPLNPDAFSTPALYTTAVNDLPATKANIITIITDALADPRINESFAENKQTALAEIMAEL